MKQTSLKLDLEQTDITKIKSIKKANRKRCVVCNKLVEEDDGVWKQAKRTYHKRQFYIHYDCEDKWHEEEH